MSTCPTAVLCLDSGTTAVKAAAFDRQGRQIASAERANRALLRAGVRVEQDMSVSRDDALDVLRECARKANATIEALVVTAQGDGLWAIDRHGVPLGPAMTWLDGRARALVSSTGQSGVLETIRAVTGSRPTTATQSLQLLWLKQNEPDRFERIAHGLRLKEWLFYSLTGQLLADPSSVLPTWGSWRTGETSRVIQEALALEHGIELLPELRAVGGCRAGLSIAAAKAIGVAEGTPVLQGPGDVQSTLIGLGLGMTPRLKRASIFGTSAIHAGHVLDANSINPSPEGAIVLKFVLGDGYFCLHPCFNGATVMQHLTAIFGALPEHIKPTYSPVIFHPFFETGGERAPYTTPDAIGALLGVNAETTPAEIAWAAREALAFISRKSFDIMGITSGPVAVGGGLTNDPDFVRFLATVLDAPVQRTTSSHASLRGLAAIAAKFVYAETVDTIAETWCENHDEIFEPQDGQIAQYASAKFSLFSRLVDAVAPEWPEFTTLRQMRPPH